MTTTHDAIIIGTGQAGPSLAARLAGAGMKTAIVERKRFGGTCVNTGCIPTKTMVASAYAARMAARAAEYGVEVGSVRVDMKRVMDRKDAVSKASRTGLEDWLRNMENCTVYQGHARFESAHEVSVGGERLHADKIFINVGGRALVPDMPGLREIDWFTNSSMMSVDFLPRHLIVVGGSYIGLEFGQMFRRFGAEVTVIEMGPRLVGRAGPGGRARGDEETGGPGIEPVHEPWLPLRVADADENAQQRGKRQDAGASDRAGDRQSGILQVQPLEPDEHFPEVFAAEQAAEGVGQDRARGAVAQSLPEALDPAAGHAPLDTL